MYYICQTLSSGIARTSGNTGFVIRQPPLHPAGALHVVADLRQRLFAQYQPREHDVEVNVFGLRIGVTHDGDGQYPGRSEEHTSELQSLMRISYAVFCLKKKKNKK